MKVENELSPPKDPASIKQMFGKIAASYDLANGILSFKLHERWNQKLIQILRTRNTLLDLCAGTGKIAYGWLKQHHSPKTAILLDFCPEMLEAASRQAAPYQNQGHSLQFIQADATAIPLPSASVDAISMAYGIRNVQDPLRCFQEAFRILKPGGLLAILELTEPSQPLIRSLHRLYLSYALPYLGGWITGQREAYRYLAKSISAFSKPQVLRTQLKHVGFHSIQVQSLTLGISTLISARKETLPPSDSTE